MEIFKIGRYFTFTLVMSILSLWACSDEDSENNFPSEFIISTTELGINHAIISWTESIDPNGGTVAYDLFLDGDFITTKTQDLVYRFDNLNESHMYEVEIFATNELGKRTTSSLMFTTSENLPPTEFKILEAGNSSEDPMKIIFKWEEATDPEGSKVTYNVFISDNAVLNPNISATHLTLQFRPENIINGYIEAYDSDNNASRVSFSFENSYPTFDKSITLTTQNEVNEFGNAGHKIILGRLDIHESTAGSITDISTLSNLIHVTQGIRIFGNSNLSNLDGLANITNDFFDIEDGRYTNVYIANNPLLQNIEDLSSLKHITKLQILNNGIRNLKGMEGLSNFSDIEIIGNDLLEDIDDLLVLDICKVKGLITIENNKSLNRINGFNNVEILAKDIGNGWLSSGIVIKNNESLESISAFSSTHPFEGIIQIIDNDQLTSIEGIVNITRSTIRIEDNANLTSINGIRGDSFSSYLSLKNNDALEHIDDAFSGLTHGDFVIEENDNLESINGLIDLVSADSWIFISNNPMLTSIEGLQNLENEDFDDQFDSGIAQFTIVGNNSLLTLNGLSNCTRYASLAIVDNQMLSDFCAINPSSYFQLCCGDDEYVGLEGNAYNPTEQDLRDGNCSL